METKELTLARDRQVRKANELIQASRFSLTTQQQKIILYLISKINVNDTDFKEYSFDIIDFCKVCGIDYKSGDKYTDLKDAIQGIRNKSMWITLDNGINSLVSWIEKARIDSGNGIVQIRLDNDLKPYLLQLRKNYTQYQLVYTLRFRSKYSIRFYEWACSIQYNDLKPYVYTCTVDELKERLGADTYPLYKNFKARVLEPSIKEINEYSDKQITYKEIKQRKKVISIELTIATKDAIDRIRIRDKIDKELGPEQYTLFDELKDKNLI